MSFVNFVAFRYLSSKQKESFINIVRVFSILGIALGVGALIVVMSVMNGFREELISKIAGFDGSISIRSVGKEFENYQEIISQVEEIEGIDFVVPVVEEQALVSSEHKTLGVLVRGISDIQAKNSIFKDKIIAGSFDVNDKNSVNLGRQLFDRLYLKLDDKVRILTPSTKATALGNIPNSKSFEVGSIYDVGMSNYNSDFVFINIEIAQKLFNLGNSVSYVEAYIKNPNISEKIVQEIAHKIGAGYIIDDWQTKNATFFNALKTERVAMFTILTLIIMVAAFNIVSSLTMLVKDKTADIAIMRTMGATKIEIVLIFSYIGISIGLIGTILGLVLGVSFALNIDTIKNLLESITNTSLFDPLVYFLSFMPSKIEVLDVVRICLMSVLLSILSTIYPTYKASQLDPVEALRYK
jgi:lipoprotein-releasing system permease protein